jgi:hypothetical protein
MGNPPMFCCSEVVTGPNLVHLDFIATSQASVLRHHGALGFNPGNEIEEIYTWDILGYLLVL